MLRSQISWTSIPVWIAIFALPAFADDFIKPHPVQVAAFAVGDKVQYICESASLRISETPDSKQSGPSVAVVKGDHNIWVTGPESGEWIRVRVFASQSAAYDGWVKTACVKPSLAQAGGVASVSRAATLSTGQLAAIGITARLISRTRSEFAGAIQAAPPAAKPGIGTVVGALQTQTLGGNVTDGSAEVRHVFPSATNNQLLALRAAIFAGLLDRLTEIVNAQDKVGVSALKRTKHTYVLIERRLLETLKNKGATQDSLIHQIKM